MFQTGSVLKSNITDFRCPALGNLAWTGRISSKLRRSQKTRDECVTYWSRSHLSWSVSIGNKGILSKIMEEPVFVKCEPAWSSDTEEPSNFDANIVCGIECRCSKDRAATIGVLQDTLISDRHHSVGVKAGRTHKRGVTTHESSENDWWYLQENSQLVSEMIPLKQETKSELTEPGSTQQKAFEPSADIKDEISIEHTNIREEKNEENAAALAMVTGEEVHSCTVCSMKFSQMSNLKRHISLSHCREMPYKCAHCNSTFSRKDNLNNHIKRHTGEKLEKLYNCDTCKKSFLRRSHLQAHMVTHSSERPYHCGTCGKSFSRSSYLRRHMLSHNGEKPFHCDTCGMSFSWKGYLRTHMLRHTGEKPFHCDKCSKSFVTNKGLREHAATHIEEKPYHCDTCGKSFSQRFKLRSHMATHTGEMMYNCDTCKKSFSQRCSLLMHITTHTEKSYHCRTCGKSFSRSHHLKRHMLIHTGERLFHCHTCGISFSQSSCLRRHLITHTGDKS